MAKIIKLTETDLRHIVRDSVKKIIREYVGDEEEFGRYDLANGLTDEDFYNIDAMNAEDEQQLEDEWAENDFKDWEAEQYIGQEYWDPTDNELYRGWN